MSKVRNYNKFLVIAIVIDTVLGSHGNSSKKKISKKIISSTEDKNSIADSTVVKSHDIKVENKADGAVDTKHKVLLNMM